MRKILILCFVFIVSLSLFASCDKKYDAKTVSEVSVLQEGQDQYDLTFLQIADLLDEYIYVKGSHVKRGTDKYYKFLTETAMKDSELHEIPEWNAVKIYIRVYGNPTGSIEDMVLDENNLPERMTGLTVRDYTDFLNVTPEEFLENPY